MSNYNKIFHKVPVEVQNRSGFNKSHENFFTAKVGTLMPVLVDDVLPNTKVKLRLGAEIQLPPMATDFYGKVTGKFEAFFVPFRLLYGGWQELITHQDDSSGYPEGAPIEQKAIFLPTLKFSNNTDVIGPGTLSDMLGLKVRSGWGSTASVRNPLPYLAYHKIWDDWYRDSRIQVSCFSRPRGLASAEGSASGVKALPFVSHYLTTPVVYESESLNFADGVSIASLRQRNWARDYFTNATPEPQQGTPFKITFATSGESGSFTMQQLFEANALQKWAQLNNLAGNRYADQIRAHFGCLPADAVLDRCIYLGSQSVDVYNKAIYKTSADNADDAQQTGNPFRSVASKYANSIGVKPLGSGDLINGFTATEHGFVFVMFSLVPEATYSTGVRRYLDKNQMSDFAFPSLSTMGDQAILKRELVGAYGVDPELDDEFGYTQRYSEYKYMSDEVHGLLSDGSSLSAFALQRSFDSPNDVSGGISSSFLEIPTNYMDQVTAVDANMSDYGCWAAVHFDYKIATPLPAYSIPTLGDLKDTHTQIIDNGGRRL